MSADGSLPKQFRLDIAHELIVDLFAGGGGMSFAIEQVFGRHADIACNHDDDALSMHRANHPQTRHFQCDVYEVDPRTVCRGRPVGLLHASPDCTHHSQAAGGQPRDRKIRALSWVVVRWAGQVQPRVISLENVKQLRQWCPLVAKRDPNTGRVLARDDSAPTGYRVAAPGERVPLGLQYLIPDKKRLGQTWRRFNAVMAQLGYVGSEALLTAADHGAATTRERLMCTWRRDGQPIGRAEVTHHRKPAKGQKRWRPAADHLDFTLPCPSIFGRKKPLADATCRRIAKGIQRYVMDAAEPFIVPATHHGGDRMRSASEPTPTITAAHRGELMLVTPHLQQFTQGGRQQGLVTASLLTLRRNCDGRPADDPLPTLTAGAEHHAVLECRLSAEHEEGALRVAAFLIRYHGTGGQWADCRDPLTTLTAKERLALVTVTIQGTPYVIVDIGLRMLTPREAYGCQGFPASYQIEVGHDGRKFSKSAQFRMCGNSVSPPMGAAHLRAQFPELMAVSRRAAA